MTHRGVLQKMPAELNNPIDYYLVLGSDVVSMNQWLGQKLNIQHLGYQCFGCVVGHKKFSDRDSAKSVFLNNPRLVLGSCIQS